MSAYDSSKEAGCCRTEEGKNFVSENTASQDTACTRESCVREVFADQQAKNNKLVTELQETLRRAKNSLVSSELYLESVDKPHLIWNLMSMEYSSWSQDAEQLVERETQVDENAKFAKQIEQMLSESGEICSELENSSVEKLESVLRKVDELIQRTKMYPG